MADHVPSVSGRRRLVDAGLDGEPVEILKSDGRSRVWLVWSPALPLENSFFPAFAGWRRSRVGGSPIIAVDLLAPPPTEGGMR